MKRLSTLTAALILLLLAGCAAASSQPRTGSITIDELGKTSAGENFFFTIPVDQAMLDSGTPVSIQTSGEIKSGQVHTVLRGPDGATAWDPGGFGGKFSANTYYRPEKTGDYHLGVTWNGPTSGSYALSYQTENLTLAALIPGLGMMLVAAAFIVYARRSGGTWAYLGLGALAWAVTVAVKFLIAAGANPPLYKALFVQGALFAPGSILFYLYIGALTGVTEVLLTWLLLRYTRLGRVAWNKALAFGIGFGAFEALLLGFSSAATMTTAILSPQSVPAAAMSSLLAANNPLIGLAPIVERIATIFVHVVCNVLLFYGVLSGRARWMWLSFAWKSLLDAVAGFAQMWGVGTPAKMWTIEAIIILFGVASWWGLRRLARMYNDTQHAGDMKPQDAPAEN